MRNLPTSSLGSLTSSGVTARTAPADYLKVGQIREHLNTAKLARGMINEHIAHLEMMKA